MGKVVPLGDESLSIGACVINKHFSSILLCCYESHGVLLDSLFFRRVFTSPTWHTVDYATSSCKALSLYQRDVVQVVDIESKLRVKMIFIIVLGRGGPPLCSYISPGRGSK